MRSALELDAALGDLAAVHVEQAGDGPQQRGLAGAVRAEDGDDRPAGDLEADAPQHQDDVVVDDLEVADRQPGTCG